MSGSKGRQCLEYIACLFMSLTSWGILLSFGTFLPYILDKYGESRSRSSIVHSVLMGVTLITGVFSGTLIRKVGTGVTGIFGGICLSGGFISSYFATRLEMLYATIGIVAGIGCSFTYVSAVVSSGRLFGTERQAIFLSIQNLVGGVGGIVLPYFLNWLARTYGINGSFLLTGGIFLNGIPCAILLHNSTTRFIIPDKQSETVEDKIGDAFHYVSMKSSAYIALLLCYTLATGNMAGLFAVFMDILTYKNLSNDEALMCLVIFNISASIARLAPLVVNCCSKNHRPTILITTLLGVLASLTCILSTRFPLIAFGTAALGASDGAFMSSFPVILFQLMIPKAQPLAYGLIFTAIGILSIGTGPFYGGIYDSTGSYFPVLVVSTSAFVLSFVCACVCLVTYNRLQKRQSSNRVDSKINKAFDVSVIDDGSRVADGKYTPVNNNLPC